MRLRPVAASAPTRIDLAGGTLDLHPISVLVDGSVTVNVAIDLRAQARVAPRRDGRVVVISRDRGRRATRRLPLRPRDLEGPLSWPLRLVAGLAPGRSLTLEIEAEAPAGAGLGGSSALGVAIAWALDRATGGRAGRDALLRRVQHWETVEIRVPTGSQDYLAALHGGLAAYRHAVDGPVRERIPAPSGLARRLVLAYTGEPRASGASNWEMFRRFVDGERGTVRRMEAIARVARELADALAAGDLETTGRLLDEEGRLRERLAPSVSTPALARAARAARGAGALGAKICGAGGGGCLVALAREGRERAVAAAMAAAGARVLPVRIAGRGVGISERRPGS